MDFTTYLRFLFILTGSLLLVLFVRTWVRLPSQASGKIELDCSEYGSWCTFKNSISGSGNGVFIQKGKPKQQPKVDHETEVAKHPLDPLTLQEIKKVQRILQKSSIFNHGKFTLHSLVLEEPPKEKVLLWKAGNSLQSRKASIIAWANGHAYKLIVDLALSQIVENQISHENGYPAMTMEDMTSAIKAPLKSKKFVEIIGKRGVNVSDLACLPISLGWFGPGEEGRRLVKVQCYSSAGTANFYMRPIEGLTVLVDMDSKEVLKITDKGKDIPLPKPEGTDYRLSAQKFPMMPPLNPISIEQPNGPSFKVDGHQVKWGSWEFHLKPDPRAGVIISQAAIKDPDTGKMRRVLYKGFTSELFVPYMDPSDAWYFKTYMDAGEYGFGLTAMSLDPLNDCPRNAYYMDGVLASDDGTPYVRPNMVCIFERYAGDIAWRHTECPISGMEIREVRPKVTLVVRMAASVANYDYIVDWEFQTDGLIRLKVGLSGILMIKGTKYQNVDQIRPEDDLHGTLLAENIIGVIHDHYITFYLDMDIDGTDNSFVQVKMAKQTVKNGQTPRRSFWKAERHMPDRHRRWLKMLPDLRVKVVEHIVLFKTKTGFSDEQEKDMLDFLYTSQYYMRGIIAISLGRIVPENPEGCTHAVYMRFPSKEVLAEYYKNTFQSRVLNEYIIPYCHGSISVDYEAEVEDDIVPLFRRGEDFEYGVEFILLISVHEGVSVEIIGDALNAFAYLIEDFGSSIIQYTQGKNFSGNCKDYTHGLMIRFPSEEALEGFTSSPSYTDIWKQKVLPITKRTLRVYFLLDPIGTTLM